MKPARLRKRREYELIERSLDGFVKWHCAPNLVVAGALAVALLDARDDVRVTVQLRDKRFRRLLEVDP